MRPRQLSILCIALAGHYAAVSAQNDVPLSPVLSQILANQSSLPQYRYPTQLTQDIVPKGFHSHNDYWRQFPFWSALSYGAISIEADIWNYNGTLYVGHEPSALTVNRTLESLYINPILNAVQAQNPSTVFISGTKNGVYDTISYQTLYLFIDVKTDGATTWPVLVKALEPLRQHGYLTTLNGTQLTGGPVTVVGTGGTPLNQIQGVAVRDYFYDGPLATLNTTNITSQVSPIASADFGDTFGPVTGQGMSADQLAMLKDQVAVAQARGIRTRYYDQPGWPIGTRNAIWRQLVDNGVDLLNVDDLQGAANFWSGDVDRT